VTTEERFWAKVDKSGECWVWTGTTKERFGLRYGYFYANGKNVRAHRLAAEMKHGPIPEGMVVCHRCDNPPCVRPDHLWIGTRSENQTDMWLKGRGRTDTSRSPVCRSGHPMTPENTYHRLRKRKTRTSRERECRRCAIERAARNGSKATAA
jgi:hypothetical protein